MRKRSNEKLNNKGFTLMEIMMAVALVAIAVVAVGAMIIGTRNNTNQLLTDAQLQKQSNNIKEMISNEIVTTNAGIKYWVKQDSSASSAYTLTTKDDGDEYEKVLAFYRMDVKNLELNKTYYLYNSEENVLKKATLTADIPNDSTDAINVDDNIKSIIDGISNWEIVANNLASFSMDLSDVEESSLITCAIAVEQGVSTYPAKAIINVRSDLVVNGQLNIDRLVSWKGGLVIPPKAIGMLTYNGEYQMLIEAGTAEHGTMYYKIGEDGTWGMTLPSEKEVGTYRVYYYVYGDDYYTEDNMNSYVIATILPEEGGMPQKKDSLNAYTWAEIKAIANSNAELADYNIVIGGTHENPEKGYKIDNGVTYYLVDDARDSAYGGLVFMFNSGTSASMNSTSTNAGGYASSEMLATVKGIEDALLINLPELGDVIKPVDVVCNDGKTNYAAKHTVEDVKLFLPSVREVGFETTGGSTYADYEEYLDAEGSVFDWFAGDDAQTNRTTISSSIWWLRSADGDRSIYFWRVYRGDELNVYFASASHVVAPAFVVG